MTNDTFNLSFYNALVRLLPYAENELCALTALLCDDSDDTTTRVDDAEVSTAKAAVESARELIRAFEASQRVTTLPSVLPDVELSLEPLSDAPMRAPEVLNFVPRDNWLAR